MINNNPHAPILLFDSGIGGLTVLREARVLMPSHRFIYVADNRAFPYGDWDDAALEAHIIALMSKLLEKYQPALVMIACNTASTLVLSQLRDQFPNQTFVGTVPAIKPAAERTASGLISVLATPGTVKRAYTRELIQSFASQCHVRLVGSNHFAALAERYMTGAQVSDQELRDTIDQCLIEKDGKRTDIVVLACTHYPFLGGRFRQVAKWPVDWLDPAEAIARHALSLLPDILPSETNCVQRGAVSQDVAFFTTKSVHFAQERLMHGFGLSVAFL